MRAKIGRKSIPPGNLAEQVQTGMPIKDMRDVEKHLRSKKQSFPTPTTFDSNEINKPRKPHPGGGQKPPLNQVVQMYPTPSVACEEGGEQSDRVERTKSGGFVLRKKNKPNMTFGAKLSDAMLFLEKEKKMFPSHDQDLLLANT